MAITLDPSRFHLLNVTDTCAIWNCLSSSVLFEAAVESKCSFSLATFVYYECLLKPRTVEKPEDAELQGRLRRELDRQRVRRASITIAELQDVSDLEARRRLGKGELASIVLARRSGQAFLTDDQAARRLAAEILPAHQVQTTPHLLGWLVFSSRLTDADKYRVVTEHRAVRGLLEPYFEAMYQEGLRCRLLSRPAPPTP